jgi:hypothetical protein
MRRCRCLWGLVRSCLESFGGWVGIMERVRVYEILLSNADCLMRFIPSLFSCLLGSICLGRCMIGLHETLLSGRVRLGWPAVVSVIPWPRGSDLCHFTFLVERSMFTKLLLLCSPTLYRFSLILLPSRIIMNGVRKYLIRQSIMREEHPILSMLNEAKYK